MAGVCKLEIIETQKELKTLLAQQKTASRKERVQALYLFKIGQVKTVKELAIAIGRDRITVQRWLQKYRHAGIAGLLAVNKAGGRKRAIPQSVLMALQQQLQDPEAFHSYGEIQAWLKQEHGVEVSYKVVHATVRYKLKTKLKATRSTENKKQSSDDATTHPPSRTSV